MILANFGTQIEKGCLNAYPWPGQYDSEETSHRWRAVGNAASDLTEPGLEPQICVNRDVFNYYADWLVKCEINSKHCNAMQTANPRVKLQNTAETTNKKYGLPRLGRQLHASA